MSTKNNAAARIHAIAEELGCAPELVARIRAEHGIRRFDALQVAVEAHLSSAARETASADDPSETPADATPKERKASLTLSQRRALLRLLDETTVTPASAFKALPYDRHVEAGYATVTDGAYTLTAKGRERAETLNPGYRVWSAGETVAGDPTRPTAGTHKVVEAGRLV
jgi:hypothetical protein